MIWRPVAARLARAQRGRMWDSRPLAYSGHRTRPFWSWLPRRAPRTMSSSPLPTGRSARRRSQMGAAERCPRRRCCSTPTT
eukprot:3592299-Prymnesium_polylepis.2